jgi:glycolate oxidase
MLEYMDRTTINAVEDMLHMDLDRSAAALLVAQSDSPQPIARDEVAAMAMICHEQGAAEVLATDDAEEGALFTAARRAAIPAVERKGTLLLEDVGVPLRRFPELVAAVEAVSAAQDVTVALIAHAGDGNTHPLIVFDPTDEDMARRADVAFGAIMEAAISLGGTITGEHGVGRLKRPWLVDQIGADTYDVSLRIKHALDPQGLLNPGAVFAPYHGVTNEDQETR